MTVTNANPSRAAFVAAIALLLLGIGAWFVFTNIEPRVGDANANPNAVRGESEAAAPASAAALTRDTNQPSAPSRETAPDATPASATDAAPQHVLRVRLRGLHPEAPWTTTLTLDASDRTTARIGEGPSTPVDAEGRAQFVLADWYAKVTKGAIVGDDPNYQPLRQTFEGPLDFTTELVVDVQVVARIEGRVVDTNGTPIANTRVTAYEMRAGKPLDAVLTTTTPHPLTGRYALRVPPSVPLLLLATPVDATSFILPETKDLTADGAVTMTMDRDVLPASAMATGVVGTPTQVADLVLQTAMITHGVVQWSDGSPIGGAIVYVGARDGVSLDGGGVSRLDDGRVARTDSALSQADGTFSLRVVPGLPIVLRMVDIHGRRVIGEWPEQTIVPPQRAEFVIPRPVILRAVDTTDVAVAKPRFEFAGMARKSTGNAEGTVEAIVLSPAKVRATRERMQSPWVDVTPERAGATLTLRLADALCPVSIAVEGDDAAWVMLIEWRRADGTEGFERVEPGSSATAFTFHLEPGRYHTRLRRGDERGEFVLPVERDFDVASEPVELVVPSRSGGQFTLWATDANGRHVAGTCRVTSSTGEDVTDRFVLEPRFRGRRGGQGEVMAGGPCRFDRTLPPGDYELQCDFVEHGARRTKVTIEPRKVADVRIRL